MQPQGHLGFREHSLKCNCSKRICNATWTSIPTERSKIPVFCHVLVSFPSLIWNILPLSSAPWPSGLLSSQLKCDFLSKTSASISSPLPTLTLTGLGPEAGSLRLRLLVGSFDFFLRSHSLVGRWPVSPCIFTWLCLVYVSQCSNFLLLWGHQS